jgi:phosphate transport system permease protein
MSRVPASAGASLAGGAGGAGEPGDPAASWDRESVERRRRIIQAAARRTLGRRRLTGTIIQGLCVVCAAIGLVPLVALFYYVAKRGMPGLSLDFFTHAPVPDGIPGGGISTAIVGTAGIVGLALLMAIPIALLAALFLHERSGRLAGWVRFGADVLTGVPSIVIGIFAYALIVRPLHHFSNVAASFALAVLMLPIMIRADEEAMRTVAVDLWEAGVALGARRSRVARSVVLRGALPGLVTGNLLAVARAVGETAPLLFTVAAPTLAMTLLILTDGTQPFPAVQQTAWTTALVLLVFVLALSTVARLVAWRLTRRAR